jgi:hypothetical protein
MLQYHHAKFSRNKISPICKLCGEEEEDRVHFLLECKTLEENRKTQMVKLCEALEEARGFQFSFGVTQSSSVAWLFRFALNPSLNMESVGLFYMRCSPR